ncbi:hypothetical protein DFH11DRAFT_306159 [Phellopilus nigrolimitatus]|nr:hypothetical protein DFH11DRAFT_306159 [Phellopilus nigrolimitatus]
MGARQSRPSTPVPVAIEPYALTGKLSVAKWLASVDEAYRLTKHRKVKPTDFILMRLAPETRRELDQHKVALECVSGQKWEWEVNSLKKLLVRLEINARGGDGTWSTWWGSVSQSTASSAKVACSNVARPFRVVGKGFAHMLSRKLKKTVEVQDSKHHAKAVEAVQTYTAKTDPTPSQDKLDLVEKKQSLFSVGKPVNTIAIGPLSGSFMILQDEHGEVLRIKTPRMFTKSIRVASYSVTSVSTGFGSVAWKISSLVPALPGDGG